MLKNILPIGSVGSWIVDPISSFTPRFISCRRWPVHPAPSEPVELKADHLSPNEHVSRQIPSSNRIETADELAKTIASIRS